MKYVMFILLTFCVGILSMLSVYESGDLPLGTVPYSGLITQGVPFDPNGFTANLFLSKIYMLLFEWMPKVSWYVLLLYVFVVASLYSIIRSILIQTNKPSTYYSNILFAVIVYILSIDTILFFQYTRVAFLLGAASTLCLISAANKPKQIILASFFMCIAALTRWEVGLVMMAIQVLVLLIIEDPWSYFKGLSLNIVIISLLVGYITFSQVNQNDFLSQFQPELGYQLIDRGNIVPLNKMVNAVDSTKYKAVTNLIADPEYISIDFLRSLIKEDPFVGYDSQLLHRAIEIMCRTSLGMSGLLLIYLSILLAYVFTSTKSTKPRHNRILLLNGLVWLMLFLIAYFIKMEDRLMSSMLSLLSFIHLFLLARLIDSSTYKILLPAVLLFTTGGYIYLQQTLNRLLAIRVQTAANADFLAKVKVKCAGENVVPDISVFQILLNSVSPWNLPDYSSFNRIYLIDADVLHIVDTYNKYLSAECKCEPADYISFMEFMLASKDSFVFIGQPERYKLIEDYCRIVRNKNYDFVVTDSIVTENYSKMIFRLSDKVNPE